MILSLQGLALFAFIPLVLFLYLRLPLGPGASLVLGLILMFGHRLLAVPWMARHVTERCLWCGRRPDTGLPLEIGASGRRWDARACTAAHRDHLARFFTFLARFRVWIALGIFVPLLLLLGGMLAAALGYASIPYAWNALQFRVVVALTVTIASLAYLIIRTPAESLSCPFPLHNLFLLGVGNTLWVFRLVGAWWLIDGVLSLMRGA